jgi:hypothetical protein
MAFQFAVADFSDPRSLQGESLRVFRPVSSAVLLAALCLSSTAQIVPAQPPPSDKQINVNWLYGSYVPRTVQLRSLSRDERLKLYVRQTYMTPGIYIKTTIFAVHDQITNSNPGWGGGFQGFAKRLGDRQIQFIIQNSVTSAGDGVLGWEPRYDRCRCNRFWPRTRHAVLRNFVTYDRTEKSLRPQVMPYLGAFGASALATTWQPGNPSWQVRGYQAAITQVFVGMGINWLGEFAPEIVSVVRKKKTGPQPLVP